MTRQHATPIMLSVDGSAALLAPLSFAAGADAVNEAAIQALIHSHPSCLPIADIDPSFAGPVPICTELYVSGVGSIDNFMVTPSGLPVLVECKLWRNPEARREVVGQILDYAAKLSRWSSSDLQREVSRRLKLDGNPLLDLVRAAGHDVDEIAFNDALTLNLRRGRFLLLIVGDGIREGVEAIAEYLQAHAGLHFTLGLVEMPIYVAANGERLVVPRIVARTHVITRTVVAVPEQMRVIDEDTIDSEQADEQVGDLVADRVSFWTDFVADMKLDDPEQPKPKVSKQGYVWVSMPVRSGSLWITVFRNIRDGKVGLFLSYTRNTVGEQVVRRMIEDWDQIRVELGGTVRLCEDNLGRSLVQDGFTVGPFSTGSNRSLGLTWLQKRLNEFVNVLRPRIKAIVADLEQDSN